MNLVVTTITLIWIDLWIVYMLSYLICCECRICVDYSMGICICSVHCVFLTELGLIPWTSNSLSLSSQTSYVRTSHTPSLTHCNSNILATDRDILLASVWHHGQGSTIRTTVGTRTPNGLRFWLGLLTREIPLHVSKYSTINILILERGWDDKLSAHICFETLHIYHD